MNIRQVLKMNIGQVPPFFIWPYALFFILRKRPLFFIFNILTREQQKYHEFYDTVKEKLEDTVQELKNTFQSSFEGDGYGELMSFSKNALFLCFGGIFLIVLKMYILIRHLNYVTFALLYYVCSLVFNRSERVVHVDELNEE